MRVSLISFLNLSRYLEVAMDELTLANVYLYIVVVVFVSRFILMLALFFIGDKLSRYVRLLGFLYLLLYAGLLSSYLQQPVKGRKNIPEFYAYLH